MPETGRQMVEGIEGKRELLSQLQAELDDLEDQVLRCKAKLRVEKKRVLKSSKAKRVTAAQAAAAQLELSQSQAELQTLTQSLAGLRAELGKLQLVKQANEASLARRKELAVGIADTRTEIRTLETAIQARAKRRAKLYEELPAI